MSDFPRSLIEFQRRFRDEPAPATPLSALLGIGVTIKHATYKMLIVPEATA